MRFDKYFRHEPRERTPGRIAAAKRAVKKEAERCGLFPELMRFRTIEERFEQMDERSRSAVSSWRSYEAGVWIEARCLFRALDAKRREEVKRVWSDPARSRRRGSMEFLELVNRVKEPECFEKQVPSEKELQAGRERGSALSAYLARRAAALKCFLEAIDGSYGIGIERAYVDDGGELNLIPAANGDVQKLNADAERLLALFAATMADESVEGYAAHSVRAWRPK